MLKEAHIEAEERMKGAVEALEEDLAESGLGVHPRLW